MQYLYFGKLNGTYFIIIILKNRIENYGTLSEYSAAEVIKIRN